MRVLIESYAYEATESILSVVRDLGPIIGVQGKISVEYVGYYYNTTLHDCVFILPKVLLDQHDLAFGKYAPAQILHVDSPKNPLQTDERNFIYELSVWIYRAISVYKMHHPNTGIVLHERMSEMGKGHRRLSNTFLDILLPLLQFERDNQDFVFFVLRNVHQGYHKINWTRTISLRQPFLQMGSPIYFNPVNKRRQVDFDEELMVIFYSILRYMHDEYGFPFMGECHYELLNRQQFQSYLQGMGKARLLQIKYKYFSDKALDLWHLCFAFFDEARQIQINVNQKEYLLAKNFELIFEDIIDELIGSQKGELPKGLQDQPDGKQVDHLYRYRSLIEIAEEDNQVKLKKGEEKIYYIGDSKYYKQRTAIGKEALYKQFTYARNVVQWNLDLFLDEKRSEEQLSEQRKGTGIVRDEETEGYCILPNFFISAQQNDLEKHDDITLVDKEKKDFSSRQFFNRLFDRDTLLVCHYNVNFLYVVSLYAKDNESLKKTWRERVRILFRKETQDLLNRHFQFYVMTPLIHVDGIHVLREHFKQTIGKVLHAYPDGVDGQQFYALALEKPDMIDNENVRKVVAKENEQVKNLLQQYFEILPCLLGEDRRKELKTPPPDGLKAVQKDELALLITKEGSQYEQALMQIAKAPYVGVALKMDGATLQLVEGFTKARYLIVHNKGSKYRIYGFEGVGPKLVPGKEMQEMVVTKKGESLYLVYQVDPKLQFFVGDLSLHQVAKLSNSYHPNLIPLRDLLKGKD